MERLPTDLLRLLTGNLRKNDLRTCLTVCKTWNYIITPYFYETVSFLRVFEAVDFLRSMCIYPRCREAGVYIRVLNIFQFCSRTEDTNSIKRYLTEALMACPNIEVLIVHYLQDIMEAIISEKMPRLQHLRYLLFLTDPYYEEDNSDDKEDVSSEQLFTLRECYSLYKSTMKLIQVDDALDHGRSAVTLVPYLASFPCLTSLILSSTAYAINYSLLDEILLHCPNLAVIRTHTPLGVPDNVQISHHRYPLMKKWYHYDSKIILKDVEYIRNRFPCITNLSFKALDSEFNNEMINLLMNMKCLTNLTITSNHQSWDLSDLYSRFKQDQVCNSAYMSISYNDEPFKLSFDKDPDTGIRTLTYEAHYLMDIAYQNLQNFGHHLNSLEVMFNNPDSCDDFLDKINMTCPTLSVLKLNGCDDQLYSGWVALNRNLTTLELIHCDISDLTFRRIESIFPSLQKLSFDAIHVEERVENPVVLPSGLKSLFFSSSIGAFRIIKERDNIPVRSWYVDFENKKTGYHEGLVSTIEEIQNPFAYTFKSSTLSEVVFDDPDHHDNTMSYIRREHQRLVDYALAQQ
ncbi:hypothetical protein BDB01DRAFT_801491 [Pilobolus umbonatus]|nr:hypothetical protein BDB01DRAFT_801491 [Pilobolus umbonatus]